MKRLRILIADDHALVRRGARGILHRRPGWKVVGEAVNGREALDKVRALKPDVAVVDIGMPELDGIELTRQVRSEVPGTKVLMLTMHESDHMVQCALDAGAHGYVLKSDLTDTLVTAVKDVCDGQRFLTPKVSTTKEASLTKKRQYPEDRSSPRATPRETEVIALLAEGKTNKEVAHVLGIGVRTVESHRAKLMLKLGFHSLVDLIHYAIRHGLAKVPEHPESSLSSH